MSKTERIHRESLQEDLARPLLNVPIPDGVSAWQRLEAARTELALAVELANKELVNNPLAEILAEHAMRQCGRRGFPQVLVDSDGSVMLEVHHDAPPKPKVLPIPENRRKSALPSIEELRAEASELGLDYKQYGKAKTALLAAIQAAKTGAPAPVPTPPAPPKAPPAAPEPPKAPEPPPVAPKPPEPPPAPPPPKPAPRVPVPEKRLLPDEEDDLASLFGDRPATPRAPAPAQAPAPAPVPQPQAPAVLPPAPRRGVSTEPALSTLVGPPRAPKGRSLSAIVSTAESEVDIDALLKAPVPVPTSRQEN